MSTLSAAQIYFYARAAGFDPDQAVTMTAIALAESGGNTMAHAGHGEDSKGLWQINVAAHTQLADVDLYDPATNAKHAYQISNHGQDVSPWTTTHADHGFPYRKFEQQAQAAAMQYGEPAGLGNFAGTAGYGHRISASGGHAAATNDGDLAHAKDVIGAPATPPTAPPDSTGSATTLSATTASAAPHLATGPQTAESRALETLVAQQLANGQNPYLVDSAHRGMSDGFAHILTGAASDSEVVHGFDLEYLHEHADLTAVAAASAPGAPPVTPAVAPADPSALDTFMASARQELGDPYVWAGKAGASVADPHGLDCSGFTQWAAARAGVKIPANAAEQYRHFKQLGTLIPVEDAKHIPGALMFHFANEPGTKGGGEPPVAHVVISDGKGGTLEAMDSAHGIVATKNAGTRFNFAAYIPGISGPGTPAPGAGDMAADPAPTTGDPAPPADADLHALVAHELRSGLNPFAVDTDHDGTSDGYQLLLHDAGSASLNAPHTDDADADLVRGFEAGYVAQHPDDFDPHV